MTTTATTDPATELAALHPLMAKAGCWPKEIVIEDNNTTNAIFRTGAGSLGMSFAYALAIVRDAAEKWLRGRGWEVAEPYGDGCWERGYIYYLRYHPPKWISGDSLTTAIEAELGRTGDTP